MTLEDQIALLTKLNFLSGEDETALIAFKYVRPNSEDLHLDIVQDSRMYKALLSLGMEPQVVSYDGTFIVLDGIEVFIYCHFDHPDRVMPLPQFLREYNNDKFTKSRT